MTTLDKLVKSPEDFQSIRLEYNEEGFVTTKHRESQFIFTFTKHDNSASTLMFGKDGHFIPHALLE